MTRSLNPRQRETLAALADLIAPGDAGLPSSREIELEHGPIDRVFRARPDLLDPLATLLDQVEKRDAASVVEDLQDGRTRRFELLLEAVLGAYFMDAEVWARLGYPGQEALPLPRAGFGAEDLVAVMMSSPDRFRRPPDFIG